MATKIADFTQQIADKEHALTLAEDKHSSESKALQNNIAELQGLRDKLNKELDELNLREEGFNYLEVFLKQDSFFFGCFSKKSSPHNTNSSTKLVKTNDKTSKTPSETSGTPTKNWTLLRRKSTTSNEMWLLRLTRKIT